MGVISVGNSLESVVIFSVHCLKKSSSFILFLYSVLSPDNVISSYKLRILSSVENYNSSLLVDYFFLFLGILVRKGPSRVSDFTSFATPFTTFRLSFEVSSGYYMTLSCLGPSR